MYQVSAFCNYQNVEWLFWPKKMPDFELAGQLWPLFLPRSSPSGAIFFFKHLQLDLLYSTTARTSENGRWLRKKSRKTSKFEKIGFSKKSKKLKKKFLKFFFLESIKSTLIYPKNISVTFFPTDFEFRYFMVTKAIYKDNLNYIVDYCAKFTFYEYTLI